MCLALNSYFSYLGQKVFFSSVSASQSDNCSFNNNKKSWASGLKTMRNIRAYGIMVGAPPGEVRIFHPPQSHYIFQ